ncbi:unnamed protein product [Scytosiphon promiscuus]
MPQPSGAVAGEGGANGNVNRSNDSNPDRRQKYACDPSWAFYLALSIIRARLGDGITRAQAGERLRYTDVDPHREWDGLPLELSPGEIEETVGHPPKLATEKMWLVFDCWYFTPRQGNVFRNVERRHVPYSNNKLSECVVVFWEGVALPTRELIRVVNNAHAVLVLGDNKEYFYLHDGFVLSAREEETLVEWGIGRSTFANSCLAVGGTAMVAFAENIWAPAVLGTLLVAAAGYRVQGIVTKMLRVRSPEWRSGHQLVPSGIHGIERVVQGVLLTFAALADLLDDRWLLLMALIAASVHVVVLEYVGHTHLTGGREKYRFIVCMQIAQWTFMCALAAGWLILSYLSTGIFPCVMCSLELVCFSMFYYSAGNGCKGALRLVRENIQLKALMFLAACIVAVCPALLGRDASSLNTAWLALQPWRWPLTSVPDSFSTGVRFVGLWLGVGRGCFLAFQILLGVFSFTACVDAGKAVGSGKRTREREKHSRGFRHYREQSIPSRNLLVPDVAPIV